MQDDLQMWVCLRRPGLGLQKTVAEQITTTSAEVTLNGGLVRESPKNPLNSGLGIIVICPAVGFLHAPILK